MNWIPAIALIAFGFLVLDNRRCKMHVVAGVIFIAAGLLFTL